MTLARLGPYVRRLHRQRDIFARSFTFTSDLLTETRKQLEAERRNRGACVGCGGYETHHNGGTYRILLDSRGRCRSCAQECGD